MIKILNLSKVYKMGDNVINALNNISIDIDQHEFVAIIGPSGSGKSTLMNILGCLDVPTSGTYYLDGHEVSKLKDDELAEIRNKKIGFVFQSFNLLQRLTALENVELPLIYRGIASKERHRLAKEALEIVGLGDRVHHRPNELSGGQQQRVAIARALCGHPQIILADEPTGALDSKTGKEVIQMLKDLNRRGKTIILITHDNSIAMQAQRVIRLQDGMIVNNLEVS